mmetsp:Transcript_37697/g.87035  ORF Transcript_37697/g.87035 Transcript_37697/m.87035 type:complete len:315 (+) Transcript_37697:643-1587(+)
MGLACTSGLGIWVLLPFALDEAEVVRCSSLFLRYHSHRSSSNDKNCGTLGACRRGLSSEFECTGLMSTNFSSSSSAAVLSVSHEEGQAVESSSSCLGCFTKLEPDSPGPPFTVGAGPREAGRLPGETRLPEDARGSFGTVSEVSSRPASRSSSKSAKRSASTSSSSSLPEEATCFAGTSSVEAFTDGFSCRKLAALCPLFASTISLPLPTSERAEEVSSSARKSMSWSVSAGLAGAAELVATGVTACLAGVSGLSAELCLSFPFLGFLGAVLLAESLAGSGSRGSLFLPRPGVDGRRCGTTGVAGRLAPAEVAG